MDKKAKLFEIFGDYPNASYKECIKEITNLTEPYYNKIKHVFKVKTSKDKSVLEGKKTKGKKNKNRSKTNKTNKKTSNIETHVNEELIEKSILDLYNRGKIDANLIKLMVDYVLKIKGISEEIDEDLDMEALRQIGLSIEEDR